MALVSYSESDSSDAEPSLPIQKPVTHAPKSAPASTTTKPTFKKVIDRSNPHKIRVNLPEPTNGAKAEALEEDGPPAKRAKIGASSSSGFNSFLPAPKRSAEPNGRPAGGLGKGVSLKTGATPGFTREPMGVPDAPVEEDTGGAENDSYENNAQSMIPEEPIVMEALKEDANPKKGNAAMFRPLSVARKPKKRRAVPAEGVAPKTTVPTPAHTANVPAKKASLFSTDAGSELRSGSIAPGGAYQPMLYESDRKAEEDRVPVGDSNPYMNHEDGADNDFALIAENTPTNANIPQTSNSLDDIASDLNLSESAKRQLFGRNRNKNNQAAVNIVNFDTDREYAANEMLRQAGEQAQHNPVRAIAPGKHSLKQLVSAASTQKDALEEHFASGRRNKKEAGSKYGW